ncbi:MAG TPA: DUF192 domain-containing protein [Candidatus Omnitrophota bacterium]|nr:DUF192 domain-containing protein [Candidatus Omnitrophota bacterium]HPT06821.1 DUF192 domain-containing protein [Candidatus Omnitrophota bacterium]
MLKRCALLGIVACIGFMCVGFTKYATTRVCIKKMCVRVEIADTRLKRAEGLMLKKSLSAGKGMLFIFPKEWRYSFWMKNMKFPLDIIWVNRQKQVVWLFPNARPCTFDCVSVYPDKPALYVLEVPAGSIKRYAIQEGDRVAF